MSAPFPRSTALCQISQTIWGATFRSLNVCMVPGCSRRTSGPICGNCTVFGDLITPPFGWMRQFVKSKVLPGSYSVIQEFFPKVIGDLIFDYLHQLCRSDRHFVLLVQLRYHAFLYLL